MTVTLNRITPGAAASTSNISFIATLVSAWKAGRRNRPGRQFDGFDFNGQPVFSEDSRVIGAVKGTLTLRYPIHCSRLSPYLYGGGGAIFGGEEHDSFTKLLSSSTTKAVSVGFPATHTGSTTRGFGQVGAGLEIRLTPHIGWMSDFSWNVVNGPDNNFGMARSGVTFAF